MGTYKITDPKTGIKIKMTGDSPPSEEDIALAFKSVGKQPNRLKKAVGDVFTNVAVRPASTARAATMANPALMAAGPLAGLVGLSGLGGQKAKEAAQKGAIMPYSVPSYSEQGIPTSGMAETIGNISNPLSVPAVAMSNISRLAMQKGLVPKNLEPVAQGAMMGKSIIRPSIEDAADISTNPLSALLALVGTPAGRNVTSKAATMTGKIAKSATSKLPQLMGKDYSFQKAQQAADLLNSTRSQLGRNVKASISRVKDIRISDTDDLTRLGRVFKKMPKEVVNKLDDPVYAIEKYADGSIKPTLGNLNKIKGALDDTMTQRQWFEAGKLTKRRIKLGYKVVNDTMRKTARAFGTPIDEPLNNYHNFMNTYNKIIRKVQDTKGTVLEKSFRNSLKPGAERSYQLAWQEMTKQIPELKRVLRDIEKYNKRQAFKQGLSSTAKRAAWMAGAGAAGGYGIGKILGE